MKNKNNKKHNLIVSLILIFLVIAVAGGSLFFYSQDNLKKDNDNSNTTSFDINENSDVVQSPTPSPAPTPEPEPEIRNVKFSAVGDNLIHTNIYTQAAQRALNEEQYNFDFAYENLLYFFEQFDINWINQETLINDRFEPASYPCFSSPGDLGKAMYKYGWRVFSLANNHSYDKLGDGVNASIDFWNSMPDDTVTAGFYASKEDTSNIPVQEVNGIRFSYLSYTEHTNGIEPPSSANSHVIYTSELDVMEKQIKYAKEISDVVVVGVHWGVEDSHNITQSQRDLALNYASWGADVIVGTHPHVVQDIEFIKSPEDGRDVLVAYSLGNFISTQNPVDNLIGMCLTFEVEQVIEVDGTVNPISVKNVEVYPVVTHYENNKSNVRSYMLKDYSDELATLHGMPNKPANFNMEYINELVSKYINGKYLIV